MQSRIAGLRRHHSDPRDWRDLRQQFALIFRDSRGRCAGAAALSFSLGLAFAGFVDISDGRLVDQQCRSAAAADLDAVAVIPFDAALHLFAVFHYHNNGSLALYLLLIIIIFSVGLLGRTIAAGDSRRAVCALQPLTTF